MISDKDTNTIYFSQKLKEDLRFTNTANHIFSQLDTLGADYLFLPATKDIWARDFMPIQISDSKFIEYRYDPDYLQGNSDDKETRELKTYPDIVCDSIGLKTNKVDIILDGGNVVKFSNTVILTDKIAWENRRNYSRKLLINKLHDLFEVEKVILIPWDKECEFGHADGMLRFINEDTVLISGFYETMDINFKQQILAPLKKAKLDWEWLRCSDKESEDNIAYINFLQTKHFILIPKINRREDTIAFDQISKYFPDYAKDDRIAQVDMTEIVRYSGALNCITWTIKTA